MNAIDDDYITVGTECVPIDTYYNEFILGIQTDDVTRDELLAALNQFQKQLWSI